MRDSACSASLTVPGALDQPGEAGGTWMATGWRLVACKAQHGVRRAAVMLPEGLGAALTLQLLLLEASNVFFLFTCEVTSSFQSQQ